LGFAVIGQGIAPVKYASPRLNPDGINRKKSVMISVDLLAL
jgi:hypothetical protein